MAIPTETPSIDSQSSRALPSPPTAMANQQKYPWQKWAKGGLGIALFGGLIWGGWLLYQQQVVIPQKVTKQRQDTIAVTREDLVITVSANGTVQPAVSVNVSPKNAGILRQLLVKEGDRVVKGQLLAKMDDTNLQGQLLQAQGQLAQAQANLQKLQAGNRPQEIQQAQADLQQAQANLQKLQAGNRPQEIQQAQARLDSALSNQRQTELILRQNQTLYLDGAISDRDLETSRSQRDSAAAQVKEAQQALKLLKSGFRSEEIRQAQAVVSQKQAALSLAQAGSRSEEIRQAQAVVSQKQAALSLAQAGSRREDIAQAQAQVQVAQGNLKTIQTQINDTEIRAPFSGIVARKYADPGAFVTPTTAGSAVSSATSSSILALTAQNQIVTYVSESNIAQIRLGQNVNIKADAYPDRTFKGKVIQISPQSIVQQNVTSFEVKVSILDDPQGLLRAGMNVQVKFEAGKLTNVLVIPNVAIVREETGTGVYVFQQDKPEFVPIKT
ncbi:MAG: efflux RND transporter periplasmic adaptor subunit, partial [Microcystaceae cyanobacterium]